MGQTYPINKHKFSKLYFSLNTFERKEFIDFLKVKFICGGRNYSEIIEGLNNSGLNIKSRALWNRLSELTRIIEDYYLLKNIRENKEERNVQLLDIYNAKKINNAVEQQFNRTEKILRQQKISSRTFFNMHRAHMTFSTYQIHNNKFLGFVKHYRNQSEYATAHFLNEILSMQMEFNQLKLENIWHDYLANETMISSMDIEKVIESFRENIPDVYLYVKFSYKLFKAFDEYENADHYFEAKKIFNALSPRLSPQSNSSAYQAFINYCINRTNNFDTSFNRVLFDIYNEKLGRGYDDDIRLKNYPTNNFRDYVIVGLRLKEYEWVDNFIDNYGKILPADYKPDEEKITRAMLYMAKNEFENALKSLEKTRRKNYLHYVDISDIRLRIYYTKEDMINAYEELARLEKYILSNELIPRERRINYELFMKSFKRLLRLKENHSNDRLAKTELFLKKQPNFFRKNWIERMIKEI